MFTAEAEPEPEPVPERDTEPEAKPETEPRPEAQPEAGSEPEPEAGAEPEPEQEPEPEADAEEKGPCKKELMSLTEKASPGVFVPSCDGGGFYSPQQCHASTGHCWCVTRDGKKINGTDSAPGQKEVACTQND